MLNKQQQNFLQDCLRALQNPILKLKKLTRQQYKSLQDDFQINFNNRMSIIIQQQTQRQNDDTEQQLIYLRRNFNHKIKSLMKIYTDVQQIINLYKIQIKKFASYIAQSSQSKKILKQKLKRYEQMQKIKEKQEKQYKKDKIVKQKERDHEKQTSKKSKKQYKNNEIEEQLQIRKAPSPLNQHSYGNNNAKIEQDKNKWKVLSAKIQQFKKKNNIYEQQLKIKQQQILSLKQNIVQLQKKLKDDKQQDQKKKLKKDNTTMRGQKVVLNNQIALLKKQLNQKIQLSDIQQLQIKKLRIQIQNINSSLNWHTTNLNQLRSTHQKTYNKQQKDQLQKIQQLQKINKVMYQQIIEQQKKMENVNAKLKKIQEGFDKYKDRYVVRINQLQSMIEEKNQTILRLKTNGVGLKVQKNNNYQSQMIRLLNKKLTEKQQKIRNLQQKIEMKIISVQEQQ